MCLTLLALLALHSICWISFFAHCHQALNSQQYSSAPAANSHLIWTFAASNLLVAGLISWSQRKTLRRAWQLAGLARLFGCVRARGAGPRPSASHRSLYYYHDHDHRDHHHRPRAAHHQSGQYAASKPVKVSPSSQSLFLISSSRHHQHRQPGPCADPQPGYHYGPAYSSGASLAGQQQAGGGQQHVYQQLVVSQHIYDSASNLNEQQPLAAMQLMHQQHHHHQQRHYQLQMGHQPHQSLTLTRSLGPQLHASHARQPATLAHHQDKPGAGQLLICPSSSADPHGPGAPDLGAGAGKAHPASQQQQQQQHSQQLPGEADGPLVAFSCQQQQAGEPAGSSQPPATFGPIHSTSVVTQSAASIGQQHSNTFKQQPTGHRLFRDGQPGAQGQQQQQHLAGSQTINCISGRLVTSGADANQHQYYPIKQPQPAARLAADGQAGPKQQNYTDALRAALVQEAAVGQHQQHFRRANSKQQRHRSAVIDGQPLMVRRAAPDAGPDSDQEPSNIYDVANYALQ